MTGSAQERLIRGLLSPGAYPHPVGEIRHIETHISHVLLTGDLVYKLKKPVDLGFVDYTTLARRRHFCEEELRLNRRLAPALYLEVVPITGTPERPRVGGEGEAIDYAVRMRAFRQEDQWDRVLERGELTAAHVEALADTLAAFHGGVRVAVPGEGLGGPEQVAAALRANFALTRRFVPGLIPEAPYRHLEAWTEAQLARLSPVIAGRLQGGFVRECHGDVHLQNVAFLGGDLLVFDCIEFNDTFRFVDVMAEVAFTQMDLDSRGRPDLGWRFINRYLERSGDYAGLALLPLYLSYRAYVRAKVAALSPDADKNRIRALVALAMGYGQMRGGGIVLMHGVTGCGKSTVSADLLARLGAVRLRSDVERKRLAGVGRAASAAAPERGIYNPAMTQATYGALLDGAETAVNAGFTAILDATYLNPAHRNAAKALAGRLGVPLIIVSCQASVPELERRIRARAAEGRDVSDGTLAVLRKQLHHTPLDPWEAAHTVVVDTETADPSVLAARVAERLAGGGAGRPAGR
ncbi:MAG: AAA family ATPase [Nitrospirae bacterium]|nr:AAA family ATPase [Nitrospirota bacterium]